MITNSKHDITECPSVNELFLALQSGSRLKFELDGKIVAFATVWGIDCLDSSRENLALKMRFGRHHFVGRIFTKSGKLQGSVTPLTAQ